MRLYRITLTDPPTEADFTPEAAQGIQRRVRPQYERLRTGISVFDTESRARQRAQRWPWLGSYIAELDVPDGSEAIRCERTTDSRGHYTLWGSAPALLARVMRVVRV